MHSFGDLFGGAGAGWLGRSQKVSRHCPFSMSEVRLRAALFVDN